MPRRLAITVLAVGTLVMAGLWVRSYVHIDSIGYVCRTGSRVYIDSGQGYVGIALTSHMVPCGEPGFTAWTTSVASLDRTKAETKRIADQLKARLRTVERDSSRDTPIASAVFNRETSRDRRAERSLIERSLSVPHWLLVILLAAYPTIAFLRGPVRRWRRRKPGLCVSCGYDLKANTSGTCPECGKEVRA